jgi:hydrogenase nickel incorporation protein HypA/HybF
MARWTDEPMHEFSLIRSLLDRAAVEAGTRHAVAVRRLSLRVGELAGVNVELLQAAYDLCRPGTICAGATLEIAAVPARWTCERCACAVPDDGPRRCARCGRPARLAAGDDLVLERIELEVDDV